MTESYFVERVIPDGAAPGIARYRAIIAYKCPLVIGPLRLPNLFQQSTPNTLVLPDVEFEILPPGPRS